jgi:hypothetical protein
MPAQSPRNTLKIEKVLQMEEEVHLSAVCYLPDEEVFAVGGWNSKQICFFDSKEDHYFEPIMTISTQHIFNLSNLQYLEELKLLLVGDCFSALSIYRYFI